MVLLINHYKAPDLERPDVQLSGNDLIIARLAGIDAETLALRRCGIFEHTEINPNPELLALLGITEDDYYNKMFSFQQSEAEGWAICERVLLATYHKKKLLNAKEIEKIKAEADRDAKRAENAKKAAANRKAFFEGK